MTHSNRFDNAFEVAVQRDDALHPPKGGAPSHVGTHLAMFRDDVARHGVFHDFHGPRQILEHAVDALRSFAAMLDNRAKRFANRSPVSVSGPHPSAQKPKKARRQSRHGEKGCVVTESTTLPQQQCDLGCNRAFQHPTMLPPRTMQPGLSPMQTGHWPGLWTQPVSCSHRYFGPQHAVSSAPPTLALASC